MFEGAYTAMVTPFGADGKVERRDLVVGDWVGDDWIIEKGLVAGEQVIVEGVQRAQPGMAVRAVPAGKSAAPAVVPTSAPARK